MSAELEADIRTKSAIRSYEEGMGVPVAGSAVLEEQFECLQKIYLIHATLGDMRFRRILPHA